MIWLEGSETHSFVGKFIGVVLFIEGFVRTFGVVLAGDGGGCYFRGWTHEVGRDVLYVTENRTGF